MKLAVKLEMRQRRERAYRERKDKAWPSVRRKDHGREATGH